MKIAFILKSLNLIILRAPTKLETTQNTYKLFDNAQRREMCCSSLLNALCFGFKATGAKHNKEGSSTTEQERRAGIAGLSC